jgi:sortase A
MGRESGNIRKKSRVMIYMMAALLLLAGGLLIAGRMFGADTERVRSVQPPEIVQAPDAIKKPEAKEPEKKDENKEEKDEPSEAPVAEAPVAEAPVAEAPVAEAPVAEAPVAEAPVEEGVIADAPVPGSTAMTLSVPKMGIAGDPIYEGVDDATLRNGAGHSPTSGYPWVPGSNTYIASHVLGYEGTGSFMDFAALPSMAYGDQIMISDANGTTYTYTVSEILEVAITDVWVMGPTGADQISLQTCINPPAYDVRLVVRGDLTSVQPA